MIGKRISCNETKGSQFKTHRYLSPPNTKYFDKTSLVVCLNNQKKMHKYFKVLKRQTSNLIKLQKISRTT